MRNICNHGNGQNKKLFLNNPVYSILRYLKQCTGIMRQLDQSSLYNLVTSRLSEIHPVMPRVTL